MFQSGKSGNPKGRPKGARGKGASNFKEQIKRIWEANLPKVQEDLDKLEPKERLSFLEKLLPYIVPKEKAEAEIELTTTAPTEQRYSWDDVPEELLFQVVDAMQEAESKRLTRERAS